VSKVSKYSVLVYSGEQGYQNNRAQITLADSDGNSLAFVRFKDPEMPCELDTETDGIITMHLPSAMFASYLDLIRNEKTDIFYQIGRAFLFAKLRRAGHGTSNLAAAAVRTVAGAPWHECPSVSTRSMSCGVKDSGRFKRPGTETDSSQPETILGALVAAAAMSRTHGPQLFP